MKLTVAYLVATFVALCVAAPAPSSYVVHEKRETQLDKWIKRDSKLNKDSIVPVSIGLTQRNLDNGHDFLMDVSHPDSPNFGKHWSMDKLKATFAPAPETIASVKSWLAENGIEDGRHKVSQSETWVKFDATVAEVEALLRTDYNIYTSKDSGEERLACEDYSVPAHLKQHIDFITPTIHFDAVVKITKKKRDLVTRSPRVRPSTQIKSGQVAAQSDLSFPLSTCDTYITPDCLRVLYNFPNGTLNKSSYGIVEYTPQAYLQDDLNLFYSTLTPYVPQGTAPIFDSIDGGVLQTTEEDFSLNGESDLDLEYAISLVYPQKVTLYQTGDLEVGASFNNFLDAIDGSYCTSGGGDVTVDDLDSTYPDPAAGGYKSKDCGIYKPAAVISTSYAYNEADLPAAYMVRQCNEYLKLGLLGTTILYSSGDYGVAGNSGQCCVNPGCEGGTYNDGGSGTFNPSFPGTCPYITSVGATQVKSGTAVTATQPEEACETVIYSGGGFSNVFPIPAYQLLAVEAYFLLHKPTYTSAQYNNSRVTRGFPDVSANGANYVIGINGQLGLVYGTSASSPTFGSIITLINEQRAVNGKGSVGFLNPVIYLNHGAFNDITSGGNQGCGTAGFTAVAGWDPLTGLGTPNYQKLLKIYLAI
ncbi:peptidase S8/S53 domain-containing protein [Calycina marina]|uniref:tripeptidyl-peptidase II n=1 Tax=Calycina marina TaxID=1763456 RepID=A0A9P7YY65_9HELO|nr:peptidase S8/S53 domain-containing protein [Calycina marina]